MSKVYVVTKFGGEYEDKWEQQVAVCSTREVAEELKKRIEASYENEEVDCDITEDRWQEMYDVLCESDETGDFLEAMRKLFPEYTMEQLATAERLYDDYDDFAGVMIEEIDYYESESELLDGANY